MKKIFVISALAMGLGLASCDSYLDINTSPNSPAADNIETDMLMPAVEMNVASMYGNFLRLSGGYFSQVYAHYFGTSNYVAYSQFEMSATRSSFCYTQLTQRGLSNLKTICEKAEAEEDWGTYLAAKTLRVFTYQVLVDCYGEVPYTEALDPTNLSPVYDDGQTIYEGILAELDEALERANNSSTVCTNFLYPSATAEKWIQFANALKLRILMRMSGVKDVNSEVGALIAEGNFPTGDVAYEGCWQDEAEHRNPFYAEDFGPGRQQNIVANLALTGTMQVLDGDGNVEYLDPRLPVYINTNSYGEYFGGISGTNFTGGDIQTGDLCRPVATYDMPIYMLTRSEVEFFISEYYALNGSTAQAAAHYAAAIEASFATAGVSGTDEYVARYPFDASNYKKSIGQAKWTAMALVNPFEGYCELRRLDYPAFGTLKGSDFYNVSTFAYDASGYVPGTLYTPVTVFGQVGDNKLLERWPYPESSASRNNNTPDFPGYTTPVFWGK